MFVAAARLPVLGSCRDQHGPVFAVNAVGDRKVVLLGHIRRGKAWENFPFEGEMDSGGMVEMFLSYGRWYLLWDCDCVGVVVRGRHMGTRRVKFFFEFFQILSRLI